nr:hypothetical protein [Phytohabitans houttuyneae]
MTGTPSGKPAGRWLAVVPDVADEWVSTVAAALGATAVTEAALEVGEYDGVVSLLAPGAGGGTQAAAATTARLLRALGEAGIEAPLWVVTRGAVAVDGTDPALSPAQAAVWGSAGSRRWSSPAAGAACSTCRKRLTTWC